MSEILAYAKWTSNADLIADVARLGYLRQQSAILDPTYGYGTWWKNWQPDVLRRHDLDPAKAPDGAMDFTDLLYADGHFEAVVFDPPYKMCLDTETEILTRRGWLRHDEVRVGDYTYSLDHETGSAAWREIMAVNIYPEAPTKVMVCEGKNLDFVATPDHRWPVLSAKGCRVWKETRAISSGDRVIHGAPWSEQPTTPTHSDALVELVAWFWTEGSMRPGSTYGDLCQSHVVNPRNCERIASAFTAEYGHKVDCFKRAGRTSSPAWRTYDDGRNTRFIFSAAIGQTFALLAPERRPTLAFLESLTAGQLELFIYISLIADGQNMGRLAQKDRLASESFALACLLSGRAVSMRYRDDGNGHTITICGPGGVGTLTNRGPHSKPRRAGISLDERDVGVWCPTVEGTSTWLARRGGSVYFTGNSGTPTPSADERYGIHEGIPWQDRIDLILRGMYECARVVRPGGTLLVKCQAQVVSGRVRWQDIIFATHGEAECGLVLEDRFNMLGHRAQPTHNPDGTPRRQVHARQNASQLLVFTKPRPRKGLA